MSLLSDYVFFSILNRDASPLPFLEVTSELIGETHLIGYQSSTGVSDNGLMRCNLAITQSTYHLGYIDIRGNHWLLYTVGGLLPADSEKERDQVPLWHHYRDH